MVGSSLIIEMGGLPACKSAVNDCDENALVDDRDSREFTKLTEMVRSHYVNYLEKQLLKNFKTFYANELYSGKHILCEEEAKEPIKQTAKHLEDEAVAACMITQFYQKAMIKIISDVKSSTKENRLLTQLEENLSRSKLPNLQFCTKQTQTEEAGLQANGFGTPPTEDATQVNLSNFKFVQSNIITDHCGQCRHPHVKTINNNTKNGKPQKRVHSHNGYQYCKRQHSSLKENLEYVCPASFIAAPSSPPPPPAPKSTDPHQAHVTNLINTPAADLENSNDSVDIELARMFSEETTEFDEIFGINPNQEPDDPKICEILKEIEQATVAHMENMTNEADECYDIVKSNMSPVTANFIISQPADLSKSLWPCELFMQRRKLSEILARLIEEDMRWHDVVKGYFFELFGDDSDDEFTSCSPSIELNEVLMGSCVKRISPWVVKYLMKPMKQGLIGNRYIFKKLAKHIARSIITENQYPDERVIKRCIENYFCLHQCVLSWDDDNAVPSTFLD